jgi:hypothetical protein
MKKLLPVVILLITSVIACKKSDSGTSSIQGKWKIVRYVYWLTSTGSTTIQKDTILAQPVEYNDFRSNGIEYMYFNDNTRGTGGPNYKYDTTNYRVVTNTLYETYTNNPHIDTSIIENLTANNLTLHYKYVYPDEKWDLWLNYTK